MIRRSRKKLRANENTGWNTRCYVFKIQLKMREENWSSAALSSLKITSSS